MAIDRHQAAEDENLKILLERRLLPQLQKIERDLVLILTRDLGNGRPLPPVGQMEAEALQPVLLAHYGETSDVFSRRVSDVLLGDAQPSPEERDQLAEALTALFVLRSQEQADQIGGTTQKDAESAQVLAQRDRALRQESGEVVSTQEFGIVAGAAFARRVSGRTTAVTMFETQAAAEIAKQAEVDMLTGAPAPSQSVPATRVMKEWVTRGDSFVRDAHAAADGQDKPKDEPFQVGGQRLMFPGDTSLGASPGNVINCRCASVHDVQAISNLRS